MLFTLFRLRFLKAVRSVTLGRRLIGGFFLALIGFILLSNIFFLGLWLQEIMATAVGGESVVSVINTYLVFYFFFELLYRFFLQKASAIELQQYLHLPIGRSTIIHFILGNSFISALNIIPVLLFGPYAINELSVSYGTASAIYWLLTVAAVSWSLHWFILWFKQKYEDSFIGVLSIFSLFISVIFLAYYDIFNIGIITAPIFNSTLESPLPSAVVFIILFTAYIGVYRFYKRYAYLEALGSKKGHRRIQRPFSLFNRFGLAGKVANLELRLILRHKRSRTLAGLSILFLFYGLLFYTDDSIVSGNWMSFFTLFIGIFITGMFMVNYGQLFLSWNSAHFDFFSTKRNGIRALVTGKYLLFSIITLCCFLLSIPYVYFGWEILLINGMAFLFNVGINTHVMIGMALWNPKPIDLSKGGMFNYEGMGAAQFLMMIPIFLCPYLIYFPFSWWGAPLSGIIAIGIVGLFGIIFYQQLINLHLSRLSRSRYNIGASFRREL